MLDIEIISCLDDNYSYLLHDKSTNQVAIVDPSDFDSCDEVIVKKYNKLDYILNTHHHFDHVGGNQKLKEKYKSKVLGFELDKDRIPGIDITLQEKQNFKIGTTSFEVIFTPGHTKGHVAFYFKSDKIIFTGDTLFSLGCGRVFEGTYAQMFSSLNKLKNLPIETKIYCGHEYTKKNLEFCLEYDSSNKFLKKKSNWINSRIKSKSPTIPISIEEEKKTNIFLRCNEPSIKNGLNLDNASDQEIFFKLRHLKDSF
ncbi:MAG: hydroxyacylglutathione hydrolase [Candidatus Pelagibacter sp. TMED153]|nr:MAG: hydroxyacylglutathione hydrolase [Candidatus Pelagibacter sp. TMED153]|tara:strand:- start:341 stop:1105 length:765 start_codon:yes stop_codon:yes gene_type:complete